MNVAIIPARGGSKRIPRKNIKQFCGKPIIAWSIEAAKNSGCFDRVIVSTDDSEIANVARQYGAEVPFQRPNAIADDHATTGAVVRHALGWLGDRDASPDFACCIYATAPFLLSEDVKQGLRILEDSGLDYVVTVASYPFPIQRACSVSGEERLIMMEPDNYLKRSQDLEEAYHDAGQLYWGRTEAWLQERPLFGGRTAPLILPRHRVQDIDTPEDWQRAEWLFKAMLAG